MLKLRDESAAFGLSQDQAYLGAGVLGIVAIIDVAYGFRYKIESNDTATYFRIWSCLFLACLLLLVRGLGLSRRSSPSLHITPWLTPAIIAAALVSTVYFSLPTPVALIAIGVIVAGCLITTAMGRPRACVVFLLAANVAMSALLMVLVTVDRSSADMLPVIADANAFLMSGTDPYTQTYSNEFFYLPLQWLAYLPFVATHLDLRVLNLFCLAFVSVWVVRLVDQGRLEPVALMAVAPILVSRSAIEMILRGQVWPYWWLVFAFSVSLLSRTWLTTAIVVGALLATQQTAIAIATLFGVYLVFTVGLATAARVMAIALVVFGMVMLPWVILQPTLPSYLYIKVQSVFAHAHQLEPQWDWSEVSVLNLLQAVGFGGARPLVQLGVLAGGVVYLARTRNVGLRTFTCLTGLVYLCAMSLNVQVFRYYLYPGLLMIALGLSFPATPPSDEAEERGTPRQACVAKTS